MRRLRRIFFRSNHERPLRNAAERYYLRDNDRISVSRSRAGNPTKQRIRLTPFEGRFSLPPI